jgi:short-subunit dehydrogenase
MTAGLVGGWAIVTGASSGIGRALCDEVASAGMHVLAVSNELEDLAAACEGVRERHPGTEVEALEVDLADPGAAQAIADRVADRDLALVVSCASFGRTGAFLDHDMATYRRMVATNVDAYVSLAHTFLPRLQARGSGGFVFVSSLNSLAPGIANSAVYTATKAFETSFAAGLWYECEGSAVDVLLLLPGPTITGFQAEAGTKVASWAMTPEEVAAECLPHLGKKLLHVAGEPNRVLVGQLGRFAFDRRVEIASILLDEALIKGEL